jgi:hypothetical protein
MARAQREICQLVRKANLGSTQHEQRAAPPSSSTSACIRTSYDIGIRRPPTPSSIFFFCPSNFKSACIYIYMYVCSVNSSFVWSNSPASQQDWFNALVPFYSREQYPSYVPPVLQKTKCERVDFWIYILDRLAWAKPFILSNVEISLK